MGEPDLIEFGSMPSHRRRWRWAVAVALVPLSIGVAVAINRQNHHRVAVHSSATAPARSPLLEISDYGYGTYGNQLSLSLSLHNVSPSQISLSQPVVSPAPGVSITSIGFQIDTDPEPASAVPAIFTMPAGTRGRFVVQYTVDCAAVRSPWPYLGDVTARLTIGSASTSTQWSPPLRPTPRPSPLPCPMPTT
jgi:hypothetical protein